MDNLDLTISYKCKCTNFHYFFSVNLYSELEDNTPLDCGEKIHLTVISIKTCKILLINLNGVFNIFPL